MERHLSVHLLAQAPSTGWNRHTQGQRLGWPLYTERAGAGEGGTAGGIPGSFAVHNKNILPVAQATSPTF